MRKLVLVLLLSAPFLGMASHIVGGEFELVYISGNSYRLNLILYFDVHNGDPLAKDQGATVRIFRMRDNMTMMDVFLPLTSDTTVVYSQPECSIGKLETTKLTYTSIITLSSLIFTDPLGYYVAWERCCRNYGIGNIYSDNPNTLNPDPLAEGKFAGQTFYLEFPPVVKNGLPFIDSTPRLFPPLSDYACVGKPYYVDFGGTDDDGDSLVYSLVDPLNTLTAEALPLPDFLPKPKPIGKTSYPSVLWRPGFSLANVMGGVPDLAISNEGLLTVTPTDTGLFVFAVKCEEFRNGVKIGEVRRDFQMLSVICKTAVPPVIIGKELADNNFTHRETMNVTFPAGIPDDQRCIEVQVSDADIYNNFDNLLEKIKIKAIGKKSSLQKVILPTIKSATITQANATATFRICFNECPVQPNAPYQIGIVAFDDACALPLLDTLRLTVNVQIPDNSKPQFIEPISVVTASLFEGTKDSWPLKVVDTDGDLLHLAYTTNGFNLESVGMDFDFAQPILGIVEDTLIWDAKCDKYDFSSKQNFHITILADDEDFCNFNPPDTAYFDLTLINPSAAPTIDTSLPNDNFGRIVDGGAARIFEKIEFDVFGYDADANYPISLQAQGIGFDLLNYRMDFLTASGLPDISSHFSWPLECNYFDLSKKNLFKIRFIVVDKNNKCEIYQADTVDVSFKILPPINSFPEITMQNLHPETSTDANTATSFWGNKLEFLFTGTDTDRDPVVDGIKIEMIEASGNVEPRGYTFTPVWGYQQIETNFTWTPDCSIFKDNVFLNTYFFKFKVTDDHCESASADTVNLTLNIKDYASTDEDFRPSNAITPNDDNINDFFAMDGYDTRIDGTDPDEEIKLPLDNCTNRFEYINIYNRWGKLVFTSDNRFFRWYAPHAAAGVYYYHVKFTNKDYKGSLLVQY